MPRPEFATMSPLSCLQLPNTDPTPIFELYRGNHGTELLAAAVAHLGVFAELSSGSQTFDALRARIGLAERPAVVLITALRAMNLIDRRPDGALELSPIAREHLVPGGPFYVGDY